jgi:hypothetical protein
MQHVVRRLEVRLGLTGASIESKTRVIRMLRPGGGDSFPKRCLGAYNVIAWIWGRFWVLERRWLKDKSKPYARVKLESTVRHFEAKDTSRRWRPRTASSLFQLNL